MVKGSHQVDPTIRRKMIYNIDKLTKQYGDLTKQEIKYLRTCNSLERWETKHTISFNKLKKLKSQKKRFEKQVTILELLIKFGTTK
jgi:capsid portal protein